MPAPPCAEPACSSRKDQMQQTLSKASKKAASPGADAESKAPTPTGGTSTMPCPPDRDELGKHSWTLLHTFAAYFPERPSASQSADAIGFMRAIGSLYPCTHCAEDFRAGMEESPPRAGSRSELSAWMCEAHNRVNRLLGKAEYDCALKNLDARWRTGREGCDAGLDED